MTFAAKYEILEFLTRGSVETFVAQKVATDERVLVYIFECPEQPPNKPTVQWVLESFRAIAPDPPELVAETGRYDATSYGYLVTKLPEKSTLQAWVRSYESRQQATAGMVVPPTDAPATGTHESAKESADALPASERPVFGSDPRGEITAAFEALRSELQPPIAADSSSSATYADAATISAEFRGIGFEDTAAVQASKPGDFTRQFFPGFEDERGNTSSPAGIAPEEQLREPSGLTERASAKGTDEPLEAETAADTPSEILRKIVFGPTDSYGSTGSDPSSRSGTASQPRPAPAIAPDKAGTISPGDVTSFFRGPFDSQRAAESAELSPAVAREQDDTGDFTRIFGPPEHESFPNLTSSPSADRNASAASDPGSLTRLFESPGDVTKLFRGPLDSQRTTEPPELSPAVAREQKDTGDFTRIFSPKHESFPDLTSSPSANRNVSAASGDRLGENHGRFSTSPPAAPGASTESALPFSSRSEPEGATSLFSVPRREPAPSLSTLPTDQSEYTRIFPVGSRKPSAGEPLASAGPRASLTGSVAMSAGVPAMPDAPPSPQIPPAGVHPQMPEPQGPPRATAVPKVAGPPWTMILILNGVFIVVVLLVVYFVLRR